MMSRFLPRATHLAILAAFLFGSEASFGQEAAKAGPKAVPRAALDHLRRNQQALKLADADLSDVTLSSETISKKSGVKHLYLQQRYQGIDIHNAVSTLSLTRDEQVIQVGNRFEKDVAKRAKSTKASLAPQAAVTNVARHLNLSLSKPLAVQQRAAGQQQATVFSNGGISLEPIPAKLVYQPMPDGRLRLAWEVTIYELNAQNWWQVRVDASTGEVLDKNNLVTNCEFNNNGPGGRPLREAAGAAPAPAFDFAAAMANATGAGVYNVFALPLESPSHGPRSLVASAADPVASPLGWHSTGAASYTITRGNNAFAYDDPTNTGYDGRALDSFGGYSPDGGAGLAFDYPVDFTLQPVAYKDAAIANLFYWNNIMHDVWYPYGFDEQSGNFQSNNFGLGGDGADHVMAEAQDSRDIPFPPAGVTTRNNANFATPPDGGRPRMQMYLWRGVADPDVLRVTAPAANAGRYPAVEGSFRPLTRTPVTGKLVLAQTAAAVSAEGCSDFTNAAAIAGNIAVVYRGTCAFANKVQNAQKAGAIAVVVINNSPAAPIVMGNAPTNPLPAIVIPAVMIGQADGKTITDLLSASVAVVVALKNAAVEIDSDFDNGIIAHEYGHGISNRLTGGRLTTSCLNNAEQMGEGWSDWFGLMLTMKTGDTAGKARGIGTYASGQPTTGLGIRPAPYSTSFSVNGFTYGATNNLGLSRPHGIGFVWATMLWDMTWDLVAKYGYDANLYTGRGGNNMAMQLVIDGLKLQPCSPGFVDGRDAILLADRLNSGGANQELIWKAFARRGLGLNARQGASTDRADQVEDFTLPAAFLCATPLTVAAVPTSEVFTGGDATVVYLGYGPQSVRLRAAGDATNTYTWSPAAGLSSTTAADPVFTPTATGTYTFTVTAVNQDQCTKQARITVRVVDVRCGPQGDLVQVCFLGRNLCVDAPNARKLLASKGGEGKLGICAPRAAKPGDARLVARDSPPANAGLTASPNPATTSTTLAFTLEQRGTYRLEVINMQGALVAVVAQGRGEAGEHFAHEFSKGRLATGLYMARLVVGNKGHFTRVQLAD